MKNEKWPVAFLFVFVALVVCQVSPVRAADKKVCVEVVLQEIDATSESETPAVTEDGEDPGNKQSGKYPWQQAKMKRLENLVRAGVGTYLPIGQTPVVYLKRLLEHFLTHEKGYIAVSEGCDERIRVELYPLAEGWTLFARYSGNGREERIDQLFPTELSQFAERAITALLSDVPISATIKRDTVLRSDSMKSAQRIRGTHHFIIGLGTQIRGGNFASTDTSTGLASESIRIFSPMTISTGYRGKFENWGIEALAQLGIGTSKTAAAKNSGGGHIDFGGDFSLALHFLGYLNPRGLNSFYLGAGANFELLWFSAIKGAAFHGDDPRSTLLGGGLNMDLLCGWEFMRASSVQFFLQAELNLPAYVIENEDDWGGIHTWFPGMSVKLGIVF
ncbi:MAG: hypothetical protein JRJ87_10930 [Deltaproteobacteria bacterium]|nr:hypothetical protein [Deltaproteobacteria bacterium]